MADVKNDIEKYLREELTPAEMHALERRALSDPFLAEALEGAEAAGPENFSVDIKSLQASIEERVSQASGKVVSIWFWPTRIAAGLALVAISAFIILSLVQQDETLHEIAQVKETVPVPSPEKSSAAPDTILERDEVISSSNKKELLSMAKPEEPKSVEKPLATSPVVEQPREVLADEHASGIQLKVEDGFIKSEQPSSAGYPYTVTEKSEKQSEAEAIARDVFSDDDAKKDKAAPVADELAKRKMTGAPVASRAASEESKPAQKFIRGKVTSTDGTELIGVNVIIKGTNIGTVTDAGGNYQLAVKDENPDLLFSFIGLETKEVEAGNRQEVNVEMNEDISQLSEVVVVGYGAENKDEEEEIPTVEFATPAGGRSEFKRYLEKNLVYPEKALESKIEGRVTIQFTVEKSGELTNFKVIKGIGYGCDEEVIRLIKEGPKWAATKRNEEPVKDKVKVRMRFRLNKK